MLRFADADILPYDFSGTSHAIFQYIGEIEALVEEVRGKTPVPDLDPGSLVRATKIMESSALRFLAARNAHESLETGVDSIALAALNAKLAGAEQVFAPEHGLPNRPWYRHHIYAPGYDTGYEAATLPGIREAVERQDWPEAQNEIAVFTQLIEAYAAAIDQVSQILESASP
jgi:N-acetylated-alpha-linked acidic dipeptidase